LEKEEILQQFEQIEKKIGRLIEVSKSLETTNEELRGKIGLLEEELKEKSQGERSYLEERDLIRSKVDSLLVRLQDISEPSK
jgi:cell division protein ZapB